MQRRDTTILIIAIVCGLLAFMLAVNFLKNAVPKTRKAVSVVSKVKGSLPIPEGMSALTISVKEIESAPDLLSIGSYVDVLGMAPNYADELELQTIVRGAQVISTKKEESGLDSITLALTSVEVEVVSKATAQAKVRLILRADGGDRTGLKASSLGITEVIRGVSKEKKVRV